MSSTKNYFNMGIIMLLVACLTLLINIYLYRLSDFATNLATATTLIQNENYADVGIELIPRMQKHMKDKYAELVEDLFYSCIQDKYYTNLDLSGLNLSSNSQGFISTRLYDSSLNNTNLSNLLFNNNKWNLVSINKAIFYSSRLIYGSYSLIGTKVDFRRSHFTLVHFNSCWLNDTDFEKTLFDTVLITGLTARRCNFTKVNIDRVILASSVIQDSYFDEAVIKHLRSRNTTYINCSFLRTTLNDCRFESISSESLLRNCKFRNTKLINCNFDNSIIIDCDFRNVINVSNSSFRFARIENTLFDTLHFSEVDFTGALIEGDHPQRGFLTSRGAVIK